jgi:hypothetical protein
MRVQTITAGGFGLVIALAAATSAVAEVRGKIGTLVCDVSAGVGMFVVQKQSMRCTFTPDTNGVPEVYTGRIDEFGLALGEQTAGKLVWGVIAATGGVPHGALAGRYVGVGADASVGAGLGANVLVGGTGRSFSLQPLSVEGETGLNIAAGVTTVTLTSVP